MACVCTWRLQNPAIPFANSYFNKTVGEVRMYGSAYSDAPYAQISYSTPLLLLYWARQLFLGFHPSSVTLGISWFCQSLAICTWRSVNNCNLKHFQSELSMNHVPDNVIEIKSIVFVFVKLKLCSKWKFGTYVYITYIFFYLRIFIYIHSLRPYVFEIYFTAFLVNS